MFLTRERLNELEDRSQEGLNELTRVRLNELENRSLERANKVLRPNKSRPILGRRKPSRLKISRWVIWEVKSQRLRSQGLGREVVSGTAYLLGREALDAVESYAELI